MWFPVSIKIKNVGSFKELEYLFSQGKVRNIQGLNLDDLEQESNGSGKSLVPESVFIALTGEPCRKGIRIVDLIRDGEEFNSFELNLFNPKIKQELTIYRKFDLNAKQTLSIWLGTEELRLSGLDEKQRKIDELIEISKEDLINYFIVYKDKYTSFFTTTDSKMKEIISRFSGSHLLKGIEDLPKNDIKGIEDKLTINFQNITQSNSKIQVYNEQIESLNSKDFDNERLAKIKEKEDKIKEIESIDIPNSNKKIREIEEDISEINSEITSIEKSSSNIEEQISQIPKDDYSDKLKEFSDDKEEIELQKKEINSKLLLYKTNLSEFEKLLSNKKKQLLDSITCPSCNYKFSLQDKEINIKDIEEVQIPSLNKQIEEVDEQIEEVNKQIEELNEILNSIEEQKKILLDLKDKNDELKRKFQKEIDNNNLSISKKRNQIADLEYALILNKNNLRNFSNDIKTLKDEIIFISELKSTYEEQIKEFKSKLKVEEKNLETYKKIETSLLKEKQDISEWITLFTKYNTYLANKGIKSIEGYSNYYLEKMGTNLNILIEGQKVLADGKSIREEIECSVIKNGYKSGKFGRFSSGERARISVATILAFQRLINLSCKNGGLDLLTLDEIIESCDSKGVQSVFKALEGINQTIEIITHTNHNVQNVESVRFTKEGGQTKMSIL